MRTRKIILLLVVITLAIYTLFKLVIEKRYLDTLHTEIHTENFSNDITGIKKMISAYTGAYNIPAISVSIIQDNTNVEYFNKGTLSRNSAIKVNSKTIYRIASTGKMMIAIITKQLASEGIINLDDSILKYIGNSIVTEKKSALEKLTIKSLLLHTGGLDRDRPATSEEDIISSLNENELISEANGLWRYSNYGYALLTLILEKASGKPYDILLKQYIKQQFELNFIKTKLDLEDLANYAIPYLPDLKFLKGEDIDYGKQTLTSGIYTNVESLSQLMVEQLKAYQQNDTIKVISPLVLNNEKVTAFREKSYYGYGIFEHEFYTDESKQKLSTVLEHGGDGNGFACFYEFSPDKYYGFIMLSSSGGQWFRELGMHINNKLVSITSKN